MSTKTLEQKCKDAIRKAEIEAAIAAIKKVNKK